MNRIIEILQTGHDFSDFFHKHQLKHVVVYGVGVYGKILIRELEKYEIEIVACIDKEVLCYKKYMVNAPEDNIPECDAIIVSPREYLEIKEFLELKTDKRIYTFVDIISETLIEVRKNERLVVKPYIEYIVLNILDHCNLKCKGCDHFACVADPYFVDKRTIYNDLKRLSRLFPDDEIKQMAVMGGEPLLHPDLLDILCMVRKFFPNTIIRLTTNALLLLKQPDEFWKVCRENKVTIVNTKYPIAIDYEKIEKKAKLENVKFRYFSGRCQFINSRIALRVNV